MTILTVLSIFCIGYLAGVAREQHWAKKRGAA